MNKATKLERYRARRDKQARRTFEQESGCHVSAPVIVNQTAKPSTKMKESDRV